MAINGEEAPSHDRHKALAGRTWLKCNQAGEAAWARAGGLASVASVACSRWGDPAAAARAGFVTVALGVPSVAG